MDWVSTKSSKLIEFQRLLIMRSQPKICKCLQRNQQRRRKGFHLIYLKESRHNMRCKTQCTRLKPKTFRCTIISIIILRFMMGKFIASHPTLWTRLFNLRAGQLMWLLVNLWQCMSMPRLSILLTVEKQLIKMLLIRRNDSKANQAISKRRSFKWPNKKICLLSVNQTYSVL